MECMVNLILVKFWVMLVPQCLFYICCQNLIYVWFLLDVLIYVLSVGQNNHACKEGRRGI